MAEEVKQKKSVLFVRLDSTDRGLLDDLARSYPLIERKKVRDGNKLPYRISDSDVVRNAIKDSHQQRVKH